MPTYITEVLISSGYFVGPIGRRMINIDLGMNQVQLQLAVLNNDESVAGVVRHLINTHQGTEVRSLESLQPGDMIQFWYWARDNQGRRVLRGHAGQVARNYGNGEVMLHGAHLYPDSGGVVGYKKYNLTPGVIPPRNQGEIFSVYAVRPNQNRTYPWLGN